MSYQEKENNGDNMYLSHEAIALYLPHRLVYEKVMRSV